jgi:hypothetical protein
MDLQSIQPKSFGFSHGSVKEPVAATQNPGVYEVCLVMVREPPVGGSTQFDPHLPVRLFGPLTDVLCKPPFAEFVEKSRTRCKRSLPDIYRRCGKAAAGVTAFQSGDGALLSGFAGDDRIWQSRCSACIAPLWRQIRRSTCVEARRLLQINIWLRTRLVS